MYELEVHIAAVHYKRSIWNLEHSLVTEVKFTMNKIILDCKSSSYSELLPQD